MEAVRRALLKNALTDEVSLLKKKKEDGIPITDVVTYVREYLDSSYLHSKKDNYFLCNNIGIFLSYLLSLYKY